jgi:tetratricopeptide (TPR) repeat protein
MQDLRQYLDAVESTADEAAASKIVPVIGRFVIDIPEHPAAPEQRADLERALRTLERFADNADATFFKVVVLSKLGRFVEAIEQAKRAHAAAPSWRTAVMTANAFRRSGDIKRAIEHFRLATTLDPKDVRARLEIGDIHLDAGEWAAALAAYETVLKREKAHPWARPSAVYCRYRLTAERKWLRQLRDYARRPVSECNVMVAALTGGYSSADRKRRAQALLARLEKPAES